MKPVRIVHVTPHLGGGVGKALLALAKAQAGAFEHAFVLLERPEKTMFADGLARLGCPVATLPDDGAEGVASMLAAADIVQLEWWNHPATFAFLCGTALPPLRLLAWCHVSGLDTPVVPPGLIDATARFVFTSSCSLGADAVARLDAGAKQKLGVVTSGVGLDAPGPRTPARDGALRAGYVGSLNFSKLHPRVVDYLAAVVLPGFRLGVWGDVQNRDALQHECRRRGTPDLIGFEGFTADVAGILASLDVFAYLLNPTHYGTGENALVEAMSAGVVPVVLDNPAERAIVEHGRSGLVVDSPAAFAATIRRLADDPAERRRLGENARDVAMTRFTARAMGDAMAGEYRRVLGEAKRRIDFAGVLGASPADWFLRCQATGERFPDTIAALAADPFARHGLGETSKGSLRHFSSRFPDDARLAEWTRRCAEAAR